MVSKDRIVTCSAHTLNTDSPHTYHSVADKLHYQNIWLFDRAGGKLSAKMREIVASMEASTEFEKELIEEVHE